MNGNVAVAIDVVAMYAIIIKLHSESYDFLRICENGTKKRYNDIACFVEAYRELQ